MNLRSPLWCPIQPPFARHIALATILSSGRHVTRILLNASPRSLLLLMGGLPILAALFLPQFGCHPPASGSVGPMGALAI